MTVVRKIILQGMTGRGTLFSAAKTLILLYIHDGSDANQELGRRAAHNHVLCGHEPTLRLLQDMLHSGKLTCRPW